MKKSEKINQFNPNGVGALNGNLYGLPYTLEECETIVIPVPWDVTVSYAAGTAKGPKAVLNASPQLDLFDFELPNAWTYGMGMLPIPKHIKEKSKSLREKATKHIDALENGKKPLTKVVEEINKECAKMNDWVYSEAKKWLAKGKKVALLGGDHSTPLGLIKAYSEEVKDLGILQIDAHADLRDAYEGFEFSHASVMFNALKIEGIKSLTQVGIRDICQAEVELTQNDKRIHTFFDKELKERQFKGEKWEAICESIVKKLPKNIYISFDIDGLDPKLCPNTGTPVAGGFEVEEIMFLFKKVVESGKKIVGFDLVEVAPGSDEWDANVGARILYRMNNLMLKSQMK